MSGRPQEKPRGSYKESAQTRAAILDATKAIMCGKGYAAVSSRKVAEAAGLKSQLVYYHFGTMDDLFVALYQREEEAYAIAHAEALAAKNPVRALWRLNMENIGTAVAIEFLALANHRKSIRKVIAASTERYNRLRSAVLSRYLKERRIPKDVMTAEVLSFLLDSLSRGLVSEASVGFGETHAAVGAYVEQWMKRLDARR